MIPFEIYQMPMATPEAFRPLCAWKDGKKPDFSMYVRVYAGEYAVENFNDQIAHRMLEEIFEEFNIDIPNDFYGRSLSVSDVVTLNGTAYFCDGFGWKKLEDF